MSEVFFDNFGVQLIERGGKIFIRYDEGHFAVKMVEYQIDQSEAEKAKRSEQDAYEVILAIQNRNSGNTNST